MSGKHVLPIGIHLKTNLFLIIYSLIGTFLFTEVLMDSTRGSYSSLSYGFVLGLIACLGGKYFFKNPTFKKPLVVGTTILFFISGFFIADILSFNVESLTHILFASFLLFLLAPYEFRKNESVGVPWVISVLVALVTAIAISLLILGLLFLLAHAIDTFFGVQIIQYCQDFGLAFFLVFMPVNLFSIFSPKEQDLAALKYAMPQIVEKTLRILIQPVMFLYVLVLLVYTSKILINFELPVGMVSVPIGIAYGLFFITITYLESQNKEKDGLWRFHRWIEFSFLPLFAMMGIGIFKRFADYGLTISRSYLVLFYFLILTSLSLRFIYKRTELRKLIKISALLVISTSLGPLSPKSLSTQSQTNRFISIIQKYNHSYQKLEDFKLAEWKLSDIRAARSALIYLIGRNDVGFLIQQGLEKKIFTSAKNDGKLDFDIWKDIYSRLDRLSNVSSTYYDTDNNKKIDDRICKIFSMPFNNKSLLQRVSGYDWYYEFNIWAPENILKLQVPEEQQSIEIDLNESILSVHSGKQKSSVIDFAAPIRTLVSKTSYDKASTLLELTGTAYSLKIKLEIEEAEIDCAKPYLKGKIFIKKLP